MSDNHQWYISIIYSGCFRCWAIPHNNRFMYNKTLARCLTSFYIIVTRHFNTASGSSLESTKSDPVSPLVQCNIIILLIVCFFNKLLCWHFYSSGEILSDRPCAISCLIYAFSQLLFPVFSFKVIVHDCFLWFGKYKNTSLFVFSLFRFG